LKVVDDQQNLEHRFICGLSQMAVAANASSPDFARACQASAKLEDGHCQLILLFSRKLSQAFTVGKGGS
jgi:hypothetical protein